MRVARREVYAGWALLVALIAITILPFISIFTTALYPSGSVPVGLSVPPDPQWGNFLEAFKVANMTALLGSSVFIVLGGGPDLAPHLDDGGLRDRLAPHPRRIMAGLGNCYDRLCSATSATSSTSTSTPSASIARSSISPTTCSSPARSS